MDTILVSEILIRGAIAGVLVLFAMLLIRGGIGFGVERIGALFMVGTASFAIISGSAMLQLLGPAAPVFIILATFNSVFFWWFTTALFDDGFRWHLWRFIPAVLILVFLVIRFFFTEYHDTTLDIWLHQLLIMIMMLHAIYLALIHRHDDLIEKRRLFRLLFAIFAGIFGLITALVEVSIGDGSNVLWLSRLQALLLFAMTLFFSIWILEPVELFAQQQEKPKKEDLRPEDQVAFSRLEALIAEDICYSEGLTISALASQIQFPEYRLRHLINSVMGFKNFNAFLNHYRLNKAREILKDPEQAHLRITEIALNLGYGSIGPFNRAFKKAEGVTPTEYRKLILADS